MKEFIKKYDFEISISIITSFSLYVFLPFFLYTPLIQISEDSFTYSCLAKLIFDGNIPALNLKLDIPVGYPLIIYFTKILQLNLSHLVSFQSLFYVLSFVFLCFQFSKFTKFGGLVIAFTFIFYSLNSYTIRHIFRIGTDSIYTSFLILLVGGLLNYFRKKNKISLFIVLFSVFGAVLLRSNGVYLYFILLILLFYSIYYRNELKLFFVSCLVFFAVISATNYIVKGYFAPFDKNRIVKVVDSISNNALASGAQFKSKQKNKSVKRKKMFYNYLTSFYKRHASYYYSMQKTNYNRISKNQTFSNFNQRLFAGCVSINNNDSNLLHFMFKNNKDYSHISKYINFETGKKNFWLYSIYILQEIIFHLKFNAILYILFFSIKKIDSHQIIFLIHLISLIILPFIHGRFIYRYIHVSEFIIYIEAILFLKIMFSKISFNKID